MLLPGDTVYMSHNTRERTYHLMGNHPEEMVFFRELGMSKWSLILPRPLVTYGKKMPFDDFLRNWQKVREEGEKKIRELKATAGIRKAIADYVADAFRLQLFWALLDPLYDSPLRKFPASYRKAVKEYSKLFHPKQTLPAIPSEDFAYGLRNYLRFLAADQGRKGDARSLYELAGRQYTGFQRQWTQHLIIEEGQQEHEDVRELIRDFQSRVSADNPFLKRLLATERLNAYPILEDASLNDSLETITGGSERLLDLIARHKGKVIYLDLWASWCARCLAQMSAADSLRQAYAGKPLVVAYLSVDAKTEKWKDASREYLPDASHSYRLVSEFKSGFVKTFKVQSIPRYLIIDQAGIVRYSHAPHPEDPQLKEILNRLLP
jgi:thiol-disulfide isomerase/thioredoxin